MQTTQTQSEWIIEVREDAAPGDVVAVGHGMAVPYASETDLGAFRESFAPNAIDPAQVIGKPFAYRHGEPIGVITGAENKPDGLYIDFNILDTVQGRDAAVLGRNGASKGLSIGFQPIKSVWNRSKTAVQHTAAQILEVSLTHNPAYKLAGATIREEDMSVETVEETPAVSADIEAREAIAELRSQIQSVVHVAEPMHPLAQFRSFGEYNKAVLNGDVDARALADQITANNAGVLPPNWIMEVKNIVDLGRPAITAFGVQSAGTSGMEIAWPYFDGDLALIVAAQETEKSEVNSVRIDIKKENASLATFAAGSDISYQLLQRSAPSYIEAHNRIMLASYALITDGAFVTDLMTASTPYNYDFAADTDGSGFRAAVFGASVAVQTATGRGAEFVLVASDVFTQIGGWDTFFPSNYGTYNVSGTATAGTLGVSVSGLPVIHDRQLGSGEIIVSNTTTAKFVEDGPMLGSVENVALLGRDVAIYGYGTTAAFNPAGIISLEVVAP